MDTLFLRNLKILILMVHLTCVVYVTDNNVDDQV